MGKILCLALFKIKTAVFWGKFHFFIKDYRITLSSSEGRKRESVREIVKPKTKGYEDKRTTNKGFFTACPFPAFFVGTDLYGMVERGGNLATEGFAEVGNRGVGQDLYPGGDGKKFAADDESLADAGTIQGDDCSGQYSGGPETAGGLGGEGNGAAGKGGALQSPGKQTGGTGTGRGCGQCTGVFQTFVGAEGGAEGCFG